AQEVTVVLANRPTGGSGVTAGEIAAIVITAQDAFFSTEAIAVLRAVAVPVAMTGSSQNGPAQHHHDNDDGAPERCSPPRPSVHRFRAGRVCERTSFERHRTIRPLRAPGDCNPILRVPQRGECEPEPANEPASDSLSPHALAL